MQYLTTPSAIEWAHSMDVQSGVSLYTVFEGFKHRGIALDAHLCSAIDGFNKETRDQILTKLLKEADNHHRVIAAFTLKDVNDNTFAYSPDRKLMLWQDITDNRDNLYSAANAAQQLLSNLGYNRYDPGIMTKVYSETAQQKVSFANFLKSKFSVGFSGKGAGASFEMGSSRTENREASQGRQLTYTENPQDHTGGWEFAMPYFREFGKNMALLPPKTLLKMSSKIEVTDAIQRGTLDETYQRLRGTEVILLKAISATLPDSLKDDKNLKYLLDSGYVDAALDRLLHREPDTTDQNEIKSQKAKNAELTWVIHAVLYAALYRGARQRIEDEALRSIADSIHKTPEFKKKTLIYTTCREYDTCIPDGAYTLNAGYPDDSYPYNDNTRIALGDMSHFHLPLTISEDADNLTVTGWPDLCPNMENVTNPNYALRCKSRPEMASTEIVLPIDTRILNLPQTVDDLCRDYEKKIGENIHQSFSVITDKTTYKNASKLKA